MHIRFLASSTQQGGNESLKPLSLHNASTRPGLCSRRPNAGLSKHGAPLPEQDSGFAFHRSFQTKSNSASQESISSQEAAQGLAPARRLLAATFPSHSIA